MTRDTIPPIRFQEACMALFSTPGKWMTLLGICVCMLIPIVGPIVVVGYLFRRFAREREGHAVEDFDFNRFSAYLKWGLMPFLTTFVLMLVLQVVLMIAFFIFFVGVFANPPEGDAVPVGMVISIVGITVVMLLVGLIYPMIALPVSFRSAFHQDFAAGFSWNFVKDFCKREGLVVVLWTVILGIVMMPLMVIGYFALLIGFYVVMAWYFLASYHLMFQHYDRYLAKGGTPIEIAPTLLAEYPAATPPTSQAGPPSLPPG